MTDQELQAIRQRTKEQWERYQASLAPCSVFQHFDTEDHRQQHLREVEEAQRQGAPF